ncbi:MAG TPA: tetratricopeptide repeat protein [Methylotenera sp.]|nr:tetratricopeptide repeat protein [Methylotenera sp.]HPH05489.1 tetratricopeptide repeat protein [Methylotenera sp.]HPN00097.1 tetratricopeptide repeat protein [Methylotenera sp.]
MPIKSSVTALPQQKKPFYISLLLRSGLLSSALALTACAAQPPIANAPTTQVAANSIANGQLSAEFVYQYLVAEIAGQRGDLATSSAVFYNLAKNSREASLAERAAKVAAYGKVPGLAVPAIKLWAELDPSSTEAQQAMTELYIASGKLDEAKPHLAKLLAKEDTRASGFLYLHTLLNKSPDPAATLKLVQSLAEPYPQLAEAHFAIAQSAYSAKQPEVALQALDKANALKPGWDLAALIKGQILYEKSPESAITFYNAFLAQYPASNEVRVSLTRTLINQKQYEAAKKQYPILIKNAKENKDKNAADITALVGLMAMQTEDYSAATGYFEESTKLGFKDTDQIYLYLAQVAEKQKNSAQAQSWYNKVSADSNHYLGAQLGIANIIANTQSADKAIDYLDNVDNLTSEQQIIVIQTQASFLSKADRNKESFELLDKAVKNMPNTPELVYDYALAAERVKKFDLMEAELRKAIAAKPDFAAAYNALGYSFADRNTRLTEALQLIEKALSFNPNDHYMLDSLGWVHYRKGNLDKALDYLQQAYKVNPDPEIAAHVGEVLWKKGKKEEAKKVWNDAIKADPKNQVLLDTVKKFGQ